jgi:uncharacterized membrane protein YphA (DoxX/SURF4 family)
MAITAAAAPPDVLSQLLHATQFLLASVFAVAAWTKLRQPGQFVAAVRGYAIVPEPACALTAGVIIGTEAVLSLSLVTGVGAELAAVGGVFLVAVFLAAALVVLHRGTDIACGCFGARDERVSKATAARLCVMLALTSAVALTWFLSSRGPLTLTWIGSRGAVGIEEAVVAATVAAATIVGATFAASASALRALVRAQRPARLRTDPLPRGSS